MICPNCSHALPDSDTYCGRCGARRPLEGDEELAAALTNAYERAWGEPLSNYCEWTDKGRARSLDFLAKARELLTPEAAKLRADLESARKAASDARRAAFEEVKARAEMLMDPWNSDRAQHMREAYTRIIDYVSDRLRDACQPAEGTQPAAEPTKLRQVIRNVLTNGTCPSVDLQVNAIAGWVESHMGRIW